MKIQNKSPPKGRFSPSSPHNRMTYKMKAVAAISSPGLKSKPKITEGSNIKKEKDEDKNKNNKKKISNSSFSNHNKEIIETHRNQKPKMNEVDLKSNPKNEKNKSESNRNTGEKKSTKFS